MKKLLSIALFTALLCCQTTWAQYTFEKSSKVEDFGLFQHVGLGAFISTTGWGLEAGTALGNHFQLRAGYSFSDIYNAKFDVDYTDNGQDKETEVEAKLKMGGPHAMLDYFPFTNNTFRITAGVFMGEERVLTAENTHPITDADGGLEIGDYIVGFDNTGIAHAAIQVNKVRPYVGLGFGRIVPRKRVAFSFDLGAQIWGTPSVYALTADGKQWTKVNSNDVDKQDDGFIDYMSKIKVFPVIKFRLSGRIF